MIHFEDLLRENKLKITPQRMAILKEIHALGHATVDEIYEKIRSLYPSLSLATVYKNLISLQEVHIIDELRLPNQKQRYELVKKPHVHAVCNSCGKITDIDIVHKNFSEECATKSGYKIDTFSIAFLGLCPQCQRA